jgi:hypothetical protein
VQAKVGSLIHGIQHLSGSRHDFRTNAVTGEDGYFFHTRSLFHHDANNKRVFRPKELWKDSIGVASKARHLWTRPSAPWHP